jgi:LPXTG-site transpeptidase (sortase) family protein
VSLWAIVAAIWLTSTNGDGERRADLSDAPEAPSTAERSAPTTATERAAPPMTDRPGPPSAPEPAPPVRLRIPAIGVDAAVVPVGQRPDGQMEIPPAAQAGWYRPGPQPGDHGSAVIAGHIDFEGARGVFHALPTLPVGAEVRVDDANGQARTYVVTAREQIAKDAVDLGRYFTWDGSSRLTLITCGGVFDPAARSYEDNIFVTAEPR